MPLLFLGFLFLMLVWLFWAMVWAAALLFWPVTLLIAGVLLWRAQMRRSQRLIEIHPGDVDGRPAPPRRTSAFHNGAFEAYRQETLRRLDEESAKFREFLGRLRRSRDKQEFDAFLAGRRGRPAILITKD
jgi:hypothetical protein